jgi:3-hydroxymyristoyl/3-hydroxydecanoyl-(acyl carrier protein) dehydratase
MSMPDVVAIDRPAEGRIVLTLRVPAGAAVFDGHFPGRPILPGVVQVDWAIRLAHRHLGLEQEVAREFQVKFRRVIGPDCALTLSLHHDAIRRRLNLEYRVAGEVAATGRIVLEDVP